MTKPTFLDEREGFVVSFSYFCAHFNAILNLIRRWQVLPYRTFCQRPEKQPIEIEIK